MSINNSTFLKPIVSRPARNYQICGQTSVGFFTKTTSRSITPDLSARFTILGHPRRSVDLAQCDFCLCLKVEPALKGNKYENVTVVKPKEILKTTSCSIAWSSLRNAIVKVVKQSNSRHQSKTFSVKLRP